MYKSLPLAETNEILPVGHQPVGPLDVFCHSLPE
jgi:hypothetical protein